MVADSWDLIERKTLDQACNKLLKFLQSYSKTGSDDFLSKDINELLNNFKTCQECGIYNRKDLRSSLKVFRSCRKIVENIMQANEQREQKEDKVQENVIDACPSHA